MRLDFKKDWLEYIESFLSTNNLKKPTELSHQELTHLFLNLKRRLVKVAKRDIVKSKELNCPTKLLSNLHDFEKSVKAGNDLKPYLSRLTKHLSKLDLLINDWGIHHFHLGNKLDNDGYMNRDKSDPKSDFLLFRLFPATLCFLFKYIRMDHGTNRN